MKKVIALFAVAGLAGVANAQGGSVSATVSNDIDAGNPSATVTLFAQTTGGEGPANMLFDLNSGGDGAISDVNSTTPFQNGPTHGMGSTDTNFTNGDFFRGLVVDVTGMATPDEFGGPNTGPVEIGSFSVTTADFTPRTLSVDLTGTMSQIEQWTYFAIVFSWGAITSAPFDLDALKVDINVVPAPGAAALLGLGGLVATRRRR